MRNLSSPAWLGVAVVPLFGAACASTQGVHSESVHSDERHDWTAEPHHISLLLGTTDDDEETAFTVGVDYEYRVDDFLGVGAVAEYAYDDIDATTFLAVADLHLTHALILQTGPGIEFLNEDDEEEFVFRFGFLYEVERGGYTWSPQLHYDATTGEDAVVFAIALGVAF